MTHHSNNIDVSGLEEFLKQCKGHVSPSDENLYYGTCPNCKKDKLGIRKDTGFYWCWRQRCGLKGYLNTDLLIDTSFIETSWGALNGSVKDTVKINLLPSIDTDELRMLTLLYRSDYLEGRGFRDWDPVRYPIASHSKWRNYVFFLLQQRGVIVGYIGRSTNNSQYRYFNMPGLKFSHLLYGDHLISSDTVVMTEGIISAVNVNRHLRSLGIYNITAVATFGAKVSPQQVMILHNAGVKNIHFWHEIDDVYGRERYEKTGDRLSLEFDVFRAEFCGSDPGDMSRDEVSYIIENPFSWTGGGIINSF